MFINNFDPVAFSLFSLEIRWYSLAYIFGILISWILCKRKLQSESELNQKFDDYVTYVIIGIIVGGRIGYVLFYNLNYYLSNLSEILMIWNGGMSFHGAIIGIIISNYIYTKKKEINFFIYLDLIALTSPIGIFFGRISNFLNSELYGRETDFFLSVKFILVDNVPRHASQIYEAIFEGIILYILLNYLFEKYKNFTGVISGLFLVFYSFFRFFIEFSREPDSQLGLIFLNLSMGQIMCIIFFFIGLKICYEKKFKKK